MAIPASIPLVLFPNLTTTTPQQKAYSWEELAGRLTAHEERRVKDGRLWSPAVYRDGMTRSNAAIESVTALVFDVDHAEPDWSLLEGYEYVAHTTFRYTADDPRWRIVLPLTRPVPAAEWTEVGARARAALCPLADTSCKDASRAFYTPACLPGGARFTQRGSGVAVDPEALPPVPPAPTPDVPHALLAGPTGGRPGDDYAARGSWGELLAAHGWVHESTMGEEQRWRRPDKRKGAGISATIGHKGRDILYVFSSSAPPFEAGKGYSKFTVYALLEHDGDFHIAATALAALGYGEREHLLPIDLGRTVDPVTGESISTRIGRREESPYIDAVTLMAQEFPEPRYAVPGLLPEGVGLLAGKPKLGKSFLALSLAIAVATGTPALGKIEVEAGDVLYLALEDGRRRLQRRLVDMLGDQPPPPRLTFATKWPVLDDGGLERMESWLQGHPETRLIIVDTFPRVKPMEKKMGSLTAQDYAS
ncbi:MAG TPA: AAA family ATPase, partial [Chloroflexota bacterium]|nr:AAA family ATPase [Chloroflexota bacterium]